LVSCIIHIVHYSGYTPDERKGKEEKKRKRKRMERRGEEKRWGWAEAAGRGGNDPGIEE
jgi:hypothetical protein